jgi:hypothetical protein
MIGLLLHALLLMMFINNQAIYSSMRCPLPKSVSDEYRDANAVFSGKVIAEEYRPVNQQVRIYPAGSEVLTVKVAVDRWWKGGETEEVVLYTSVVRSPDGLVRFMSEDFVFRVGEKYLVYAYESKDKLGTNVCTRTAKLENAGEDLRELGEGKTPVKRQDAPRRS